MQKRTILVVDDDILTIDLLEDILESEGYQIKAATTGEQAITICKQALPDLVLLDVMMPGINGFETCRRLKLFETIREIPVIFMTAMAAIDEKVKGFEVGGVDYITKPIAVEEVLARIKTHINIRSMHKQLESQNKLLQQEVCERQKKEAHIRTLSRELMKAQENERQRISFELHDQIAQDLAMLKISVDTLFDYQVKVPANMREKISEFSKILKTIITAVRDLAYDLRSPLLEQFGLVRTVAQLCDDFSKKTGLRINFVHSNKLKGRIDVDTEVYLFRLIQEAINNIWKHADARHAKIELALASPTTILRIEDDGRGFDVENCLTTAQQDKRMGLRNIKERISLIGGEFHIQSSPLQGTMLFIEVPVVQKADRDSPGYEPS